jgi:hypothetical protein
MSRRMIPDAATVGLWRLDEAAGGSAIDVGPSGLTGTNNGTTAVAVTGMPFAYARQFVGASSQYITVPYNSVLNTTLLAVDLWIKFTSLSGTFTVIGRMDSAGNLPFMMQFNGGTLVFQVQSVAGYRTLNWTYGGAITTDVFYYLALTFDGQFSRIFQHGVQAAIQDFGSSSNLMTGYTFPLTIGRADYGGGGQYFSGVLGEVRLSNRARAPWEIYNTWKGLQARDPVAGFGVEP